jgi:hypothetical protein
MAARFFQASVVVGSTGADSVKGFSRVPAARGPRLSRRCEAGHR